MNRIALCALVVVFQTGCVAQYTYRRETADADEIVWGWDGHLVATKNGHRVAEATTWSGLSDAVFCVDRAKELAAQAEQNGGRGSVVAVLGLIAEYTSPLTGIGTGVGLFVLTRPTLDAGPAAALAVASGVLVGSALFFGGAGVAVAGVALQAKALPEALDAVNMYNDERETTPACLSR